MKTFTLKSRELSGQFTPEYFFDGLGVGGGNISPDLYWENAPKETKCFAITIYDPATQSGSGWWHWVVFNLPVEITSLQKGAGSISPELFPASAVSSLNDFGKTGYGGPVTIPGSGFHPYIITVHALSDFLALDRTANPALAGIMMNPLVLAKSSIISYLKV
ncbi:YbhB/YbcL family Raf kinase inhibitor-like protein [Mucilaginibacter psychrotolerans]|uniref:YbhB/YbcL family Raf kinase inhibitor-like protein n=1 Tax=Mucilaginibacter psychrotolerans TaxID=1524096 RepID=A0A4Y8S9W7_9SPHI|nr:YbhB/YbcL family Raf kinase inhibitor-like protein [Mucilaginibacter psychrotolerans]TFF35481.1 YbhB/YbcL family Raf kinase inhibitor-like protein [Mucilaginibacter psychrotolerans]